MKLKRIIAALTVIAVIINVSACGEKKADNANNSDGAESVTSEEAASDSAVTLSNPVAVDENGEVDMEKALAYQTDIDTLIKSLDAKTIASGDTVSDNTNEKTQKVYDYLTENFGKNMLAGQQMFTSKQTEDLVYYSVTGDLPAIKGFDLLFSTGSYTNEEQVDMAIEWHNKSNGLVSLCWHWNVPKDIDNPSKGYAFYRDEITNFDLYNAITPGTKEYEQVIHDIDTMAIQLQRLESAGVPVIWRPLHEGSGTWFWWGLLGKAQLKEDHIQPYTQLWYILWDRLENYHKLTNLIWLWNGQTKYNAVNKNTYDISGTDIYPSTENHTAQVSEYKKLCNYTDEGKMTAISECGYIPDPEEVFNADNGVKWLYYMPWYGDFIGKASPAGQIMTDLDGTPEVNPDRLSVDFLKKVFSSDNVITWSELPDWGGTERELPDNVKVWEFEQERLKKAKSE